MEVASRDLQSSEINISIVYTAGPLYLIRSADACSAFKMNQRTLNRPLSIGGYSIQSGVALAHGLFSSSLYPVKNARCERATYRQKNRPEQRAPGHRSQPPSPCPTHAHTHTRAMDLHAFSALYANWLHSRWNIARPRARLLQWADDNARVGIGNRHENNHIGPLQLMAASAWPLPEFHRAREREKEWEGRERKVKSASGAQSAGQQRQKHTASERWKINHRRPTPRIGNEADRTDFRR